MAGGKWRGPKTWDLPITRCSTQPEREMVFNDLPKSPPISAWKLLWRVNNCDGA
jgi:hypothetical protein